MNQDALTVEAAAKQARVERLEAALNAIILKVSEVYVLQQREGQYIVVDQVRQIATAALGGRPETGENR